MKRKTLSLLVITLMLLLACAKKYDSPPLKKINDAAQLKIAAIKSRCAQSNSFYRFGIGDTNLYCTVTMDETNGNIYKQVFAQDDEGKAIMIKLQNTGGLYTGDHIRINLNGALCVSANNMIYLDSIDIEKSVVKLSSGNKIATKSISISNIINITNPQSEQNLQSQLVELNNVEFIYSAREKPFANAIGRTAYEYQLTDCSGKEIGVRTSGMSNFAAKLTPKGNGKLIGVIQQYNSEFSILIRNYNELNMTSVACTSAPPSTLTGTYYLLKDFNDNKLTSGGWSTVNTVGKTAWTSSNLGQSSYYARIYNKTGTEFEACESWLISPEVDLGEATTPLLHFFTANSSTASPLSLMLSENYFEGSPQTATWEEIPFKFQKSSFTFFPSGDISLEAYKGKKVKISYKYSGTESSGSVWNVENVVIREDKE